MTTATCRHCGSSIVAEGAAEGAGVCPVCGGVRPVGEGGGIPMGAWFSFAVCLIGVALVVGSFFTHRF